MAVGFFKKNLSAKPSLYLALFEKRGTLNL